tara:strand:- start:13091 stop:14359 length:1269 start_codon:yes stop_codon:yes gene_type:complete
MDSADDDNLSYGSFSEDFFSQVELLKHRIDQQQKCVELVGLISHQFSKILPSEIDESIIFALKTISEFIGIDRSYIMLFASDNSKITCTHEWHSKDSTPLSKAYRDVTIDNLPRICQTVREATDSIYIRDINSLSSEWTNEQIAWSADGVLSKLISPLLSQNSVLGFICFDSTNDNKTWTKDDIFLLSQTSRQFISQALVRKELAQEEQKAKKSLQVALEEKEVLLREVYHRVKNNMQVIASLLQLQSGKLSDDNAIHALDVSQDRVRAMALVHEKLYQSHDLARLNAKDYVADLAKSLMNSHNCGHPITLKQDVDAIKLTVDHMIPLGLIINEMISNAQKHAFSAAVQSPEITISLKRDNDSDIIVIIQDNGVGMPDEFDITRSNTLGMSLVQSLTRQLRGHMELSKDCGTRFMIKFPARE